MADATEKMREFLHRHTRRGCAEMAAPNSSEMVAGEAARPRARRPAGAGCQRTARAVTYDDLLCTICNLEGVLDGT